MSSQQRDVGTEAIEAGRLPTVRFIDALIKRLFAKADFGRLRIETPGGRVFNVDGGCPGPHAQLKIHRWSALRKLISGWDVGVAESYMAGDWSTPNLYALLAYGCCNAHAATPFKRLRPPRLVARLRHALNRNTRCGSRRNIVAHYDLGNGFYEKWLDAGMNYSSALYCADHLTLEQAQQAKLDRVVDLLEINGGEEVLEIGCGWGALAERLSGAGNVAFTGVTISTEQMTYGQERIRSRGRAEKCELRLQDYRDVDGSFDRVVSIEMLEAVGESYWPVYFAKLRELLRPGGFAILQVITIDQSRFAEYRSRPDFIQRYIFPGGMLPTTEIIETEVTKSGLRLLSTEFFKDSYARTLDEWNRRFQKEWPAIKGGRFDERFKRMWEYYLSYCQIGFATGVLNVGLYKISK
jgi:cyclopropane-fatty-acyl-phospholipid synthase